MVALCVSSVAFAQNAQSPQTPNPAIVRIITPERDGASYGSGVLVAVNDTYGLVVTNWHVVRDAAAPVWVEFPNGFRSAATVLKTDRDWDLAALAIWRPNVTPLPVAINAPQLGERLTIAGYGSGWFRAISGQCTQYVSPGGNHPFEMIELSAPARNGDSGGPILNDRGEVAGVLFGSAFGQTTGSYCGRLRWFLSSVADDFYRLPSQQTTMVAQQLPQSQQQSSTLVPVPVAAIASQPTVQAVAATPTNALQRQTTPSTAVYNREIPPISPIPTMIAAKPTHSSMPNTPVAMVETQTPLEQLRNFLAIVGCLAVLIQGFRIIGKFAG